MKRNCWLLGLMALLPLGAYLAAPWTTAAEHQANQGDLKAKVQGLVDQIEKSSTDATRSAAEWELIKLGPDALPFLPVKDRLAGLRFTLGELRPRTWILKGGDMPLAAALDQLAKDTGLPLADRRQQKSQARVTFAAGETTYWQAVEALARQTQSRISLYQPDSQVALVDGPPTKQLVSLHGPFRVALKRISAIRDLEAGTHVCRVGLEIAWEPRFRPYMIEPAAATLTARKDLVAKVPSAGPVFVSEHNAREFEMLFTAPPRAVANVSELAGHFVVTAPVMQHQFTFKKPKVNDQQAGPDGIRVTLSGLVVEKTHWMVEWKIDLPAEEPRFESFQSWLHSKAWMDSTNCYFDKAAGDKLRPDPLRTQVVHSSPSGVTVRFHFLADNPDRLPLEDIAAWRLVLRTPGRSVEMTVPYQFKDVPLP